MARPDCPLCGESGTEALFEKESVPYFRCPACSFSFATPASNPNLENAIEDFETSYLDYLSETAEDPRNLGALFDWISEFASLSDARVLDVGAGGGKFVRYLRSRGVNARGLEPSQALHQRFLAADDFFVRDDPASFAARSEPESFDVVTALDVIEHVPQPREFLGAISRLLRPGGLLFVSTPDPGSLSARLLGRRWHYYNRYHLSYLSRPVLQQAATAHGFELVHFSRRGRYHSVGYALEYFVQFVLARQRVRLPRVVYGWVLPMNLHDVLYACFRKG